MYCLGWDLNIQLQFDKLREPVARTETETPLMNSYRAGDGKWFWLIGLEADRGQMEYRNIRLKELK